MLAMFVLLVQNTGWDVGDGFDSAVLDTPAAQPPGQRPEQTWNCRSVKLPVKAPL